MVKNRHFLPFFGPKTPFFAIFWHPVYPPSKTPFLAVLPPLPSPGSRGTGPQISDFSSRPQRSEWGCLHVSRVFKKNGIRLEGHYVGIWVYINRIVMLIDSVGLTHRSETCTYSVNSFLSSNSLHFFHVPRSVDISVKIPSVVLRWPERIHEKRGDRYALSASNISRNSRHGL
jgi:hypothetical protein